MIKTSDQTISARCTICHFDATKSMVREELMPTLEAGQLAPLAKSFQPFRLVVALSEEERTKFHAISQQPWFYHAPSHIVIIGDHDKVWQRPHCDPTCVDTSTALVHMLLKAEDMGLGATTVAALDQEICRELLQISEHEESILILAVGHPDPAFAGKEDNPCRKMTEELVTFVQVSRTTMRCTVTLLLLSFTPLSSRHQEAPYGSTEGLVFGMLYRVTYRADQDLSDQINEALQKVNRVANPFDSIFTIYAANNNLSMAVDSAFYAIYSTARKVYEQSGGTYDVTIVPLANAWGFGSEKNYPLTQQQVGSLMELVGVDKVPCTPTELTKANLAMELDFASVAKGYAFDFVGEKLCKAGVTNYLVEIGGEIAYSGRNPRGAPWRVGISGPDPDSPGISQELQEIIDLPDV